MVNSKHIATFLMGAAIGAAAMKYNSMTKEEQEELLNKIKGMATDAQDEATKAFTQMQDYFKEMQSKGMDALKGQIDSGEKLMNDFMANLNPQGEKKA